MTTRSTTPPTPPLTPELAARARAARDRIDALLESIDTETLDALQASVALDLDAGCSHKTGHADAPKRATPSPRPPEANDTDEANDAEETPSSPDPSDLTPLRDRAWVLHCRGMRSPRIAEELDIPARTVRHWLARDRAALEGELSTLRREQTITAVESLRGALAAAWTAFEDERATEEEFAQATRRYFRVRELTPQDAASAPLPPRSPTHAVRYLSLILRAQADLIRLLGLSHSQLAGEPAQAPEAANSANASNSVMPPTIPTTPAPFTSAPSQPSAANNPTTSASAQPSPALATSPAPIPAPAPSPTEPPPAQAAKMATALIAPVPVAPAPNAEIAAKMATADTPTPSAPTSPQPLSPAGQRARTPTHAPAPHLRRHAKAAKMANTPILVLPRHRQPLPAA